MTDLQYSLSFINLISYLHLQTFRSQAAIVSEKSTGFTFSHRKALACAALYIVHNIWNTLQSPLVSVP